MTAESMPAFLKRLYVFVRLRTRSEWVLWTSGLGLALTISSIGDNIVKLGSIARIIVEYWRLVLHGAWDLTVSLLLPFPVHSFVKEQATVVLILTAFLARAYWLMGRPEFRKKDYTRRTALIAGFGLMAGVAILIALVEYQNWGGGAADHLV